MRAQVTLQVPAEPALQLCVCGGQEAQQAKLDQVATSSCQTSHQPAMLGDQVVR
jgi:hypothetical protein